MRAAILPYAIILPKTHRAVVSMTVFCICTTQLHTCSYNYKAIRYLDKSGVLQQEYSQLPTLTLNFLFKLKNTL